MNTEASFSLIEAQERVLAMQIKLHRWATDNPHRRFRDIYNLVYDPNFLRVAWERVRRNKGARTAGIDNIKPNAIVPSQTEQLLKEIAETLKSRNFIPQPVKPVEIPKANGKIRKLGIPIMVDRIVQASLKLVLEPIFEVDFDAASYGFRPMRKTHDAIAEIHKFTSFPSDYHMVFEGDIEACFDHIDHTFLMKRVRVRIQDKRVLFLIKLFLKSGIMAGEGTIEGTYTGTPQGGILSPLLANIALCVLDDHFRTKWESYGPEWTRYKRRKAGGSVMRLIRYADDFVVLIHGSREEAETLYDEITGVLAPIGLKLSKTKTRIVHVSEGFDFLGWHIRRQRKKGTNKEVVYTYPSKKSIATIKDTIRKLTRRASHRTLADLLIRLNPVLRGWCAYFRHGVSKATFSYIDHFAFLRILGWLKKRHPKLNVHTVVRRYLPGWHIAEGKVEMFRPQSVAVVRYRYRGNTIPSPWEYHIPE